MTGRHPDASVFNKQHNRPEFKHYIRQTGKRWLREWIMKTGFNRTGKIKNVRYVALLEKNRPAADETEASGGIVPK